MEGDRGAGGGGGGEGGGRLTHTDLWHELPECWHSWGLSLERQWQWQPGLLQSAPASQTLHALLPLSKALPEVPGRSASTLV